MTKQARRKGSNLLQKMILVIHLVVMTFTFNYIFIFFPRLQQLRSSFIPNIFTVGPSSNPYEKIYRHLIPEDLLGQSRVLSFLYRTKRSIFRCLSATVFFEFAQNEEL